MKWLVILALFWASVARAQTATPTPCTGSQVIPISSSQASECYGQGTIGVPPPFSTCFSVGFFGTATAWSSVQCPNGANCLSQCNGGSPTTEQFGVGLIRFPVSPLPLDAVVTAGTVVFPFDRGSEEDNLQGWAEWYQDFTFPGTSSDYVTTPANTAFNLGSLTSPGFGCLSGTCTVPLSNVNNIPTTGGVAVFRTFVSNSTFTSCNSWGWGRTSGSLTVQYSYPCNADTPTPGTPTSTPTVTLTPTAPAATATQNAQATETQGTIETQTVAAGPQATQTQGAKATETQSTQETQTAAPTNTSAPTVTGTVPTATRTATATPTITPTATITPPPQAGCCVCPDMCSSAVTLAGCPLPCTFGGPGTVCVLVQ